MNSIIPQRLSLLRKELRKNGLKACIVPSTDPHQSEYTAAHWRIREYLSGFTGSAGILTVGAEHAGLWTDSRYFLQAEQQLQGTGIELFKMGLSGTPSPEQWITQQGYNTVGINGAFFSEKDVRHLASYFRSKDTRLNLDFDPYKTIWPNRPDMPEGKIYPFPEMFCGESASSKINRLLTIMFQEGGDALPITTLDEIAWLFNLRGEDIDYNPVGIGYAWVDSNNAVLFANASKLRTETVSHLKENNIQVLPYQHFLPYLRNVGKRRVLADPATINHQVYQNLSKDSVIIENRSPIAEMKAVKNETEITGFGIAMIKDGVALTRFWKWLEETLQKKRSTNEWELTEKIASFRKTQQNYVCESFHPIAGFNENGAIVHYTATPENAASLSQSGFLLFDSGGHYLNGTTDITRSCSLWPETPTHYKKDYTSILKGLIALSSAIFPKGTRGSQLDVLARQFLWKRGLHYGHGTGHGVGHFLNVHEGPQNIRTQENPTVLEPGMIISCEPGIYHPGDYGIRLENLLVVTEKETTGFGTFLSFETLSLYPFDQNSMDTTMLNIKEKDWINRYHQTIYEKLSPHLDEAERQWLKNKTQTI